MAWLHAGRTPFRDHGKILWTCLSGEAALRGEHARKPASPRAVAHTGTGMKAKNYKPTGAFDAACFKWLGIPAIQASRIVVIGVAVGAMMETFMVKVWIGKTNCACCA